MERNEITIFRLGTEKTTWAEWRVRPTIGTALKTAVLGAIAVGAVYYGKQAYEILESAMKPQYVVNGASIPEPEPTPVWQPRTDWSRKIKR